MRGDCDRHILCLPTSHALLTANQQNMHTSKATFNPTKSNNTLF